VLDPGSNHSPCGRQPCNLKMVVEYDGTAYHGFQIQARLNTIQAELERALFLVTGEQVRIAGAGRTDAGVHALGQVVSFKSITTLGSQTLVRALNARLPEDIVVKECTPVAPEFHARFSAKSREYRYTILNREVPVALGRALVYHYRRRLDVPELQKAAERLLGVHDFASFARVDKAISCTVRTVLSAGWQADGDYLHFDIVANAFLPQMVRGIVGTLLWVGTHKIDVGGFQEIFDACDRRLAGPTAPAQGLCFVRVIYE
jgi:tRNA pseudouridine38-40 synthase